MITYGHITNGEAGKKNCTCVALVNVSRLGCSRFSWGVPGFLGSVPGFLGVFQVFGCSVMFRDVPVFRVPVFLEILHAVQIC